MPGLDTVKLFCPNCNDVYVPPSSKFQGVDGELRLRVVIPRHSLIRAYPGAFFGTTFAHLFFQSYRELAPAPFWKVPSSGGSSLSPKSTSSGSTSRSSPFSNPNPYGGQKRAAGYVYVPRIYGFKVSERAKSGPRMHWLRLRPESPGELDLVDWRGRWIDEDDEYDDDDDEDGDRQMEDFDPDAVEGEEEDEEEEEEEEDEEDGRARDIMQGQQRGGQRATDGRPPTPIHSARTSPTSSAAPRLRIGINHGHPTTAIEKATRPSQRKGVQSTKTKFVRSVIREVAGFSAYERRVMELLRNSKDKKARKLTKKRLGTLLRSKRKLEELSTIIQESRRAAH
ncbi:hypothetical protein DXG03_000355 [Asterophora parasitica]|uniref:60S ribosomal protein L36 n=1 Tax=Asterophora parasitica TaxID=117018 RepID=A0A9P7KIT3_9AGAR|nr:hypothetical protein DXG03_000355 [Asterophora parasitica]